MTIVAPNHFKRAADRARRLLKPGDRLGVEICGGRIVHITMVGWSSLFPDFIASKTMDGDEFHPYHVVKRNGEPISFRDSASICTDTVNDLAESLKWALAEIDGKNTYDGEVQFNNCRERAEAALTKAISPINAESDHG